MWRFRDQAARPRQASLLVTVLALSLLSSLSDGQVFGEGGLFNRKKDTGPTQDQIGLPVPVTGRVESLRGHEVTFEIRAESKTPGATVEFLIRTFPSAGRIVSMVSNPGERNKAIVTYYADPNSSATVDAFAFAVRYRGGRYSPAMRYDIDLVDRKSDIMVTESVDFGEVMIGDEEIREVTVVNGGEGSFTSQIFLTPPWHLIEPVNGKLMIGPNGRRRVKVAFRPELRGETSYFLSLSRSKRGTTKLLGSGTDSFAVVTEELELILDKDSNQRKGEIVLMNHSMAPIRLKAQASSRLQESLEKEYFLLPAKETRIPVRLGRTDTAPFDGLVQFSMGSGYSKAVKVVSKVIPGRIEVTVPNSISSDVINFGKVVAGKSTERQITLTNPGGVAVPLEFHIPEPFRLLTNPGPQLGALASMNLSIGLYPTRSRRGVVDVTMNVYANEGTVPVRLLGNVVRPEGDAKPHGASASQDPLQGLRLSTGLKVPVKPEPSVPPVPSVGGESLDPQVNSPIPSSVRTQSIDLSGRGGALWYADLDKETVEAMTSPSGVVTLPIAGRVFSADLRRPEDLSVVAVKGRSVTIGWTAPRESELCHFEVELRGAMVTPDSPFPISVWAPYDNVEFVRIDRLVKAKIMGLTPKAIYDFRVLMIDENGRSSANSKEMTIETGMPMDWTYIYLLFGVGVFIALGLGVFQVLRNRRPEVYQAKYVDH